MCAACAVLGLSHSSCFPQASNVLHSMHLVEPHDSFHSKAGWTHHVLLQVLLKGDERLVDVISQYCKDSSADLLVTGSQNLCVDGEWAGTVCPAAAELAHCARGLCRPAHELCRASIPAQAQHICVTAVALKLMISMTVLKGLTTVRLCGVSDPVLAPVCRHTR